MFIIHTLIYIHVLDFIVYILPNVYIFSVVNTLYLNYIYKICTVEVQISIVINQKTRSRYKYYLQTPFRIRFIRVKITNSVPSKIHN